jgi:putative membrane protein
MEANMKAKTLIISAAALALTLGVAAIGSTSANAQMMSGYGGYGGYGYGMMGGYGGYGGFGMIVWFIVLIAIVALVVWLVRSLASPGMHHMPPRRSSALDVLEERYARGEINRDEYLEKKRDLG